MILLVVVDVPDILWHNTTMVPTNAVGLVVAHQVERYNFKQVVKLTVAINNFTFLLQIYVNMDVSM